MLTGIYAVLVLLFLLVAYLGIEKFIHQRHLQALPIRIWVNGSRGKSSVTRLIADGLRAKYKRVIAKTTGTAPRYIVSNNKELPIIRFGLANIREQLTIFRKAKADSAEVIVLECMALRPDLQMIESRQIIKPNAIVITNVRPDHLDVMGPSINDIAQTFVRTIPAGCPVFTTENQIFETFKEHFKKNKIEFITSKTDEITDRQLKGFSYLEHRENISLALAVCRHLGIEKKSALRSMYQVQPDPGALKKYNLKLANCNTTLFNALAANDPESIYKIWQSIDKKFSQINILINCRADRLDRSVQIAEFIKDKLNDAALYFITGSGTDFLHKKLCKLPRAKERVLKLGNRTPAEVVAAIQKYLKDNNLIFAIGNTVGYGTQLVNQFLEHRSNNVN